MTHPSSGRKFAALVSLALSLQLCNPALAQLGQSEMISPDSDDAGFANTQMNPGVGWTPSSSSSSGGTAASSSGGMGQSEMITPDDAAGGASLNSSLPSAQSQAGWTTSAPQQAQMPQGSGAAFQAQEPVLDGHVSQNAGMSPMQGGGQMPMNNMGGMGMSPMQGGGQMPMNNMGGMGMSPMQGGGQMPMGNMGGMGMNQMQSGMPMGNMGGMGGGMGGMGAGMGGMGGGMGGMDPTGGMGSMAGMAGMDAMGGMGGMGGLGALGAAAGLLGGGGAGGGNPLDAIGKAIGAAASMGLIPGGDSAPMHPGALQGGVRRVAPARKKMPGSGIARSVGRSVGRTMDRAVNTAVNQAARQYTNYAIRRALYGF